MDEQPKEAWASGEAYERYVGRWSRRVAREFIAWLGVPSGQVWGDVGCGTGALVESILALAEPSSVLAIDQSAGFLATARANIDDPRVRLERGDATALPWPEASCDVTVSGLVLNFVPDAHKMVGEMARVTRPEGTVALYVWDYSSGMQMMRLFWDAAAEVSPEDTSLDEAGRFPFCQPEPLKALFQAAGLRSPEVRAIEIPTVFRDFDDYWQPFLGKQGPAPSYLASLDDQRRERIQEVLRARLAPSADGSIALSARAWAVQAAV
jgi:SAM-dependent methyltransferase